MNLTRKAALTVVTLIGLGLVATPAPAHADSSWGCGGWCLVEQTAGS